MTHEQSGKVFDAFTQADVTTQRKYGGTGLGLAIVSRFCELMGGTVAVESRLGEGSRFVVHLPLEMVETPIETATAVARLTPGDLMATIMVVEDNEYEPRCARPPPRAARVSDRRWQRMASRRSRGGGPHCPT